MAAKNVQSGQPWRPPGATQQNGWDAAAEDYLRRRERSQGGAPKRWPIPADVLLVRNDAGVDLAIGAVVKLGSKILSGGLDPDHIWLAATKPADPGSHGILRRPIPDGDIDECQVSGVCLATVNVISTSHRWAYVLDNNLVLQSVAQLVTVGSRAVAELIERPTSTGEQTLAVRLPVEIGGDGTTWSATLSAATLTATSEATLAVSQVANANSSIFGAADSGYAIKLNKAGVYKATLTIVANSDQSSPSNYYTEYIARIDTDATDPPGKIQQYITYASAPMTGSDTASLGTDIVVATAGVNVRVRGNLFHANADDCDIAADSVLTIHYASRT